MENAENCDAVEMKLRKNISKVQTALQFKVHKIAQITKTFPSYSILITKGKFIQTSYIRGSRRTQGLQDTNFHESQINNNEIPQKCISKAQRSRMNHKKGAFQDAKFRIKIINKNKISKKWSFPKYKVHVWIPKKQGFPRCTVHTRSIGFWSEPLSLSLSLEFPGYASGYSASVPPLPDSFAVFLVLFASVNHSALPRQRFSVGDLSSAAKRRWKESRGYGGAHQDNDTCLEQSSAAS